MSITVPRSHWFGFVVHGAFMAIDVNWLKCNEFSDMIAGDIIGAIGINTGKNA